MEHVGEMMAGVSLNAMDTFREQRMNDTKEEQMSQLSIPHQALVEQLTLKLQYNGTDTRRNVRQYRWHL